MQKVYSIQNLDCANCAAKAEAAIRRVPGVEDAVITFSTMQLRLTAQDPEPLLPLVLEAARKVEPDILFLSQETEHDHHEHHHCDCGHEHHHSHNHAEKSELPGILAGAGLFLAGLLWTKLFPTSLFHVFLWNGAYLLLGWKVLFAAGKNLIRGKVFDENFLMSIATLGAFAIGEYPEAVGIMLFYRVGEYFEHQATQRSRSQIMEAVDLRPETVTLADGKTVPAETVQPGQLLLVRAGDRIPLDGTVVSGNGHIDTAPITGEPVPVTVTPGSSVLSGCVNTDGLLTIRAEKPLSESMVTRILHCVENAAAGKPKIDRFITRFARVYTPVVVLTAAATAIIPSLITGDWHYWIYTALSFLVMSCPCALVLSVPLAFFSGIGQGSKKGILFKGGLSIEALADIKAVVMDKTGTLTKGDFTVQSVTGDPNTLPLCAACEQHSSHPIAKSILAAAEGLTLPQPQQLEELSGLGIRAQIDGRQILCGSEALLAASGIPVPLSLASDRGTIVYVAEDTKYLGHILIADTLKEDATDAVARLKEQGIITAMLTGDRADNAAAVAAQLGIDIFHAQLLPQQKLDQLLEVRKQHGAVMFVGDGINDAPVLAGADVGAAMGSGADAAIEASDVVFMTSQASAIPEAIQIARQTRAIAWQNVVFALAVKLLVMVLGLLGYASMWAAVFADSGVAMLCVINSIRGLYQKRKL